MCSSARTFSPRVRFKRSAIPLSSGVSWTVFSPSIRAQDFNGAAVILRACPGLESLVGGEDVALHCEEVGDCVSGGIVRVSDEIASPGSGGYFSGPRHIGWRVARA